MNLDFDADLGAPGAPASRRFVFITRTIGPSGGHALDAIADDGTAWYAVLQRGAGLSVSSWQPHPPLPPIN